MREVGVLNELLDSITIAVDRIRSLYSKRDSSSEEEEFCKSAGDKRSRRRRVSMRSLRFQPLAASPAWPICSILAPL